MEPSTKRRRALIQATRSAEQLAHALRRWRQEAGLTQAGLSALAGVRQATISKMEKGAGTTSVGTIYAVCAALELELVVRPRPPSEPLRPEDF